MPRSAGAGSASFTTRLQCIEGLPNTTIKLLSPRGIASSPASGASERSMRGTATHYSEHFSNGFSIPSARLAA